jgi:hypothetical protein
MSSSPARPPFFSSSHTGRKLRALAFESLFRDELTLAEAVDIILREFPGEWAALGRHHDPLDWYLYEWLSGWISTSDHDVNKWNSYLNTSTLVKAFMKAARAPRSILEDLINHFREEIQWSVRFVAWQPPQTTASLFDDIEEYIDKLGRIGNDYQRLGQNCLILRDLLSIMPRIDAP